VLVNIHEIRIYQKKKNQSEQSSIPYLSPPSISHPASTQPSIILPTLTISPSPQRATHNLHHLRLESQIVGSGHNAQRIGMAHAAAPALDAHDGIAGVEHAELDGVGDAPLEAAVDVLLPRHLVEVGLVLREQERVHAPVQVRVARGPRVARHHDDRAHRPVLG